MTGDAQSERDSTSPDWLEHRSGHFVVRCPPGSVAAAHVADVAGRLEGTLTAALEILELPASDEPIVVIVNDPLVGDVPGDAAETTQNREAIYAEYSQEAPAVGLERDVVAMVLRDAVATPGETSGAIIDGLLGCVTQRRQGETGGQSDAALSELRHAGHAVSIEEALKNALESNTAAYHLTVTSFVTYLLGSFGPERFLAFARENDPDRLDLAASAAFGKSIAALETEWAASVDGGPSSMMGMSGFLRRAVPYLRPYWRMEILILLGVLVETIYTLVLPLSFKYLVDKAIIPRDYDNLRLIAIGLIALFIVQALSSLGKEYLSATVGTRVANDIRLRMFRHLQRLSHGFYSRSETGALMSRFSLDLQVVENALTRMLPMALSMVISFAGSLIVLFALEWRLTLVMLVTIPIFVIGPMLIGPHAAKATYATLDDEARVASTIQENLAAQAVVRSFGLQDRMLGRFQNQISQLARSTIRGTFLGSLIGMIGELSMGLIQVVALTAGGWMVIRGDLSLGSLIAFQALLGNVAAPMASLSGITQMLQEASGGMQRIDELLDEPVDIEEPAGAQPLPRLAREIRFDGVEFGYLPNQPVLHGLDLTIPAGQFVAVVGPSGSGKSTVISLVMRFYDPDNGAVTVDGHDLREVTLASLRDQTAVVLQETFLFNDTIRENIRLGRQGATDAEVEAAAKAAEVHGFVTGLPHGYDTVVGERGGRLSGGQRQRLALARAVLRDPALLVLDEPTSALDPQTERAVLETLATLRSGRTIVLVTHRLAAVVDADRIVVVDHGRVAEQGRHDELLARGGLYRRLWEQQEGVESDEGELGSPAALLHGVSLFKHVDDEALARIAQRLIAEQAGRGEIVVKEGEAGDRLYIIKRGEVEVVTTGLDGTERRLTVLGEGDYFGELALLDDAPRTATVRSRSPSLFLTLQRQEFLDLLGLDSRIQEAVQQVAAERRLNKAAALQR